MYNIGHKEHCSYMNLNCRKAIKIKKNEVFGCIPHECGALSRICDGRCFRVRRIYGECNYIRYV